MLTVSLPLLMTSQTKILTLMNGLVDDDVIRLLKQATGQSVDDNEPLQCCRTLYGGLAFIAANRTAPGAIHHLSAGPIAAGVASTQLSIDMDTAKRFYHGQEYQEALAYALPVSTRDYKFVEGV